MIRLGQLVQADGIQTGPFGSQLHADEYRATGVGVVMPQDISSFGIDTRSIARISKARADQLERHRLIPGDIVYSRRGDVTRKAFISDSDEDFICGTGCLRVRIDPALADSRCVHYSLGTEEAKEWIRRHAVGATMPNLNTSILSSIPLELPTIETQKTVVEILSALDEKIAANRKVSVIIDDLLSALFKTNYENCDPSNLSEIAKVNELKAGSKTRGSFRYVDIASVADGDYAKPKEMAWSEAPGRARRLLRSGDTIWSTVRPNRRSHALVLETDDALIASTGLAVLTPKKCGPAFLYEATRQPKFQAYLESVAEGSAYPAVKAADFKLAPVPAATPEDRELFESVAGPIRSLQSELREENRKLAVTRDELLPLLMSGKITLKNTKKYVEVGV